MSRSEEPRWRWRLMVLQILIDIAERVGVEKVTVRGYVAMMERLVEDVEAGG